MAKRFTDTDLFRKPFIRGLQGAYKLLWIYLYHDCNHAGIWIVDFEIASIFLGETVTREIAAKKFAGKFIEIDDGEKWFIPSFISFQYGELNPNNRAHNSVIQILTSKNLYAPSKGLVKPLISPLQGAKDKDKDKVKDKDKDKDTRATKKNQATAPSTEWQKCVDAWDRFLILHVDHGIDWGKGKGQEPAALKQIIKKIIPITDKYRNQGNELYQGTTSDNVVFFWEQFLEAHNFWPDWNKDKFQLTIINKFFDTIYAKLKKPKTGGHTREEWAEAIEEAAANAYRPPKQT